MHTGCTRPLFLAGAMLFAAIASLGACGAGAGAETATEQTVKSQVEPAIKGLMTQYGVPGASVAIAYRGKMVYQGGIGLSDVAAGKR